MSTEQRCPECGCLYDEAEWGYHEYGTRPAGLPFHCHECFHWLSILDIDADPDAPPFVIAHGTHYQIGPSNPDEPRHWKGYGGRRWHVCYLDGRTLITDNLWCQGDIPDHFRARFPDNAVLTAA